MTDNDIVKALECCTKGLECKNCPANPHKGNYGYCTGLLLKGTLDLINRQKDEIERLNDKIKGFEKIRRAYQRFIHESIPNIQTALDNVLKELVGEDDGKL